MQPESACAGQWTLFDSTDRRDHQRAKAICKTCPMFDACTVDLVAAEALAAKRGGRGNDVGPIGTWAGRLVGVRDRKPLKPIEHGTLKGAWAHRNRKVDICDECKAAEAQHLAQMRARNPRRSKGNRTSTWENKSEPDRGVSAPQPGSDRTTFSGKEAAGEQHRIATHRHAS